MVCTAGSSEKPFMVAHIELSAAKFCGSPAGPYPGQNCQASRWTLDFELTIQTHGFRRVATFPPLNCGSRAMPYTPSLKLTFGNFALERGLQPQARIDHRRAARAEIVNRVDGWREAPGP